MMITSTFSRHLGCLRSTKSSLSSSLSSLSFLRQQCRCNNASSRYLSTAEPIQKTALVLGSSGALGSAVARHLSQEMKMLVVGADIVELPTELAESWDLDGFIRLPENADLSTLTDSLVTGVHEYLHDQEEELDGLNVIVVASGGWEGDPPEKRRTRLDPILLPDEKIQQVKASAKNYTESVLRMRRMNLDPVIAAGVVAQHYASTNSTDTGLMVVMGATAALSPTPGMIGYGLAKSATHHLVQSLGAISAQGNPLEHKSIRRTARAIEQPHPYMTVVGILPTTIDTPNNRRAMPNGKFYQWTKPTDIAAEIGKWAEYPTLRPHSGSLVKVFSDRMDGAEKSPIFELVY